MEHVCYTRLEWLEAVSHDVVASPDSRPDHEAIVWWWRCPQP